MPVVTGLTLRLTADRVLHVWPHPGGAILFLSGSVVLAIAGWGITRVAMRRICDTDWLSSALYVCEPLVFLPLSVHPLLFRPWLPPLVVGNTVFFLPILVASLSISRVFVTWGPKLDRVRLDWPVLVGCFFLATICFWSTGLHFTRTVGFHSGDEGHYMIQAESLYRDHDLDLTNNLPQKRRLTPERRLYLHISPLSRNGRAYSWHPFGLSLLLAPTVPGGEVPRHLVLGLIAGLGCTGMLVMCRIFRARTSSSLLVTGLFALSTFWGIYSSRALPEVLGASLLMWLTICTWRKEGRPLLTSVLGGLCCAYLPWAHARFIPPGLVAAVGYVAVSLARKISRRERVVRLGPFLLICGISGCLYLYVQNRMFERGSAYLPAVAKMFDEPFGWWHVLAASTGVLHSLPMFAALFSACFLAVILEREERRWMALHALLSLLAVLLTSCTTPWFSGGASLAGRFVLVVAPLLLAPTALLLERTGYRGRTWFVFLGMVSCAQFFTVLICLEKVGRNFATPFNTLRSVLAPLDGLVFPLQAPDSSRSHTFAILLYVITALLLLPKGGQGFVRRWRALLETMLFCVIAAAAVRFSIPEPVHRFRADRPGVARKLAAVDLEHAWIRYRGPSEPICLFEVSNLFPDHQSSHTVVTSLEAVPPSRADVVSQEPVPRNHRPDRSFAWSPIVPGFEAGRGTRVCRLKARLEGEARATFAVREGPYTLIEDDLRQDATGMLTDCWVLKCEGRDMVNLLLRLDGTQGVFRVESLEWSPVSRRLLESAPLILPAECTAPQPVR